jgi:hypothetical protein
MWEPPHQTTLWPPRPVSQMALPFLLTICLNIRNPVVFPEYGMAFLRYRNIIIAEFQTPENNITSLVSTCSYWVLVDLLEFIFFSFLTIFYLFNLS